MNMLDVQDLSVRYGRTEAVAGVSFHVRPGDWLMIVGPNGAGKSSVVRAVAQAAAYTGRITWNGEDLRAVRPHVLARRLGVLSQNHAVGYSFTVEQVVRLGRYAWSPGLFSPQAADGEARVARALADTGLTELRGKSVLALSGGELQRVFLAQVFAQDPALLILDEPTNHLDMVYQKQIFALLEQWLQQPGRAVISVMHDLSMALAHGTGALLLDRGRPAGFGPVREVLSAENLQRVYGMDVSGWMRAQLALWQEV